MKIAIDLQGAQSESSHRGIGRYAKSMAVALATAAGSDHEVWIALNGRLGRDIEALRQAFDGLVPQERIVSYSLPGPLAAIEGSGNDWRRSSAELLREDFLRRLDADWIWHTSMFEGWLDDATTSTGLLPGRSAQSTTLYDLIPLARPQEYLSNPVIRAWYLRKVGHLHRQDLCFAISEWTRHEGATLLGLPTERITTAVCGVESSFRPMAPESTMQLGRRLKLVHGIDKDFVLYVGGFDPRKNVPLLISAFAQSSPAIRNSHQLVIAGRISEGEKGQLRMLMRTSGIAPRDAVFTGQIDDQELVELYCSCSLFVFPSLHEGFGLTVLEAMACGAPVLAANATSLPEVVGRADMLFDPGSAADLADHMARALSTSSVLREWSDYGKQRALRFTWTRGAEQMLAGFEKHSSATAPRSSTAVKRRPRLAYISPLPPEQSGIADYSAELLPELCRHYQIDVVVQQPHVGDAWILANLPVRTVAWFEANAHFFDRILYQFGNSPFHLHMFGLLERYPGTVVLHDSYIGALSHWRSLNAGVAEDYLRRLYDGHGYRALLDDKEQGRDYTIGHYPGTAEIFASAMGVLVHSQYAVDRAQTFYGNYVASWMRKIPFPKVQRIADKRAARQRMGVVEDEFLVCSFGMLAPTKLNHRLLEAWLSSKLATQARCRLIFVGENHGGDYGQALSRRIDASGAARAIQITGFAGDDVYKSWLAAADVAVQLRTESRGETSAAVYDCLGRGLPLIVNAHATFAELPDECLIKLKDDFSDAELTVALEILFEDESLRLEMGEGARKEIAARHSIAHVAAEYCDAIEAFAAAHPAAAEQCVIESISAIAEQVSHTDDVWKASQALVCNRKPMRLPQIFVDVTVLAGNDLKTGIERVTRNVAREMLKRPSAGHRVELVKLVDGQYLHAREFALNLLDLPAVGLADEPAEPVKGDVFLGLDWVADKVPEQLALYQSWRDRGIAVHFVIYDLLPVLQPQFFPKDIDRMHARWLSSIAACADGLICISRTVADELRQWLDRNPPQRSRSLSIGYSHIGADLAGDMVADAPTSLHETVFLERLTQRPTVLMVGTVEPRKGQQLVLDAFDELWAQAEDVNLVMVGKLGWHMDAFAERISSHGELNSRLFWQSGISDAFLNSIYAASDVLLVASEGEGFGLPLIEAARHNIPVIARDLAVFREVAGSHASYFQSNEPIDLAKAVRQWFVERAEGKAPKSDAMPWLTWSQSAANLGEMLLSGESPGWLQPWLVRGSSGCSIGPDGLQLMCTSVPEVRFIDWGDMESWGRWALGRRPRIQMRVTDPRPGMDLLLDIRANAFVNDGHPQQNFGIYVNGHLLAEWSYDVSAAGTGVGINRWIVPAAWLGTRGELEVTITQEQSISPTSLGLSADARSLGLGVHSFSLHWADHASALSEP